MDNKSVKNQRKTISSSYPPRSLNNWQKSDIIKINVLILPANAQIEFPWNSLKEYCNSKSHML